MNEILSIKGKFDHISNRSRPGSPKLPNGAKVSSKKLQKLIYDLQRMEQYWKKHKEIPGMLISVFYIKIAAKSNRISGFFSKSKASNEKIVGAKFGADNKGKNRHIITYNVNAEDVQDSIKHASNAINILENQFGNEIDYETFNDDKTINKLDFNSFDISRTMFKKIIVDAWFVEKFDIDESTVSGSDYRIVTFYNTGREIKHVLKNIGININNDQMLDEQTVRLSENDLKLLDERAPYLTAMSADDLSKYTSADFGIKDSFQNKTVPAPTTEPVVGVIDTPFDTSVYFSDWVDYEDCIDPNIPRETYDGNHGTCVDSIIVDGPSLNPELDDGCGRFRIKHFGVALSSSRTSSFTLIKKIESIIRENQDIKVWNLSLGSETEVNKNFISAEGAALDKLQIEYNVIFVVSATNKRADESENKRIGAPADSINSIVVGAVDKDNNVPSYSRKGGVLSFFIKPDISCFGGDTNGYMKVVDSYGQIYDRGTSFSAAWITRKLAYLIEVIGLSREVAKALIIDSAYGWGILPKNHNYIGNGIVPRNIKDILETQNDEIRFVIQGISDKWNTYNYNLPIPTDKDNKYPFFARATMCYFSKCTRAQGVDYTNTELDLYLGRIKDNGNVDSINENHQSDLTDTHISEEDARNNFRKWDTVKHINQTVKASARPKKVYKNPMWGINVKSKDRLGHNNRKNIPFGIVVTLKEMNGENRIDDFIQRLHLRGWLVSKIDVQERINVYNQAEQDIEWE